MAEACDVWPPTHDDGNEYLPSDKTLRILVIGKSNDKRSKLVSVISENSVFNPGMKHRVSVSGKWREKSLTVVKTPDLFIQTEKIMIEEMKSCVSLCSPGPNVLLLIVKPSEFTENNRETLNFILSLFGPDAFKHAMVVVTHEEKEHSCVNELLHDCNGRFYNMFEENREELMKKIENIVQQNKGSFLTITKKTSNILPTLKLVLCGSSAAEKSSVVQSMFGGAELTAVSSPGQCVPHQGDVCGRWVSLVELPALSGKPLETVMQQSLSCISLCAPEGVHAFILVLPVGPLTDEHKTELKTIQDTFSSKVNVFTMILFTVDSDPTAPAVVNFIKGDRDLQELCQSCGGGSLIFNTRGQQQLSELMDSIETLKNKNKPNSYTTDTLHQARMEKILDLQEENLWLRKHPYNPRIVLLGKSGSGKSSLANAIIGKDVFKSDLSPAAVTTVCQREEAEVEGQQITLMDTPGLFDTTMTKEEVNEKMVEGLRLLAPGPHAILLVLPIGRIKQKEMEMLKHIEKWFGKNAATFSIVVFTVQGDENVPIERFIHGFDSLKKLVSDCGNRHFVFNHKSEKISTQVKELMRKINDVLKENSGRYLTNSMFQEAEAIKQMERLLQEKDEEVQRLKEELQTNYKGDDSYKRLEELQVKYEQEKIKNKQTEEGLAVFKASVKKEIDDLMQHQQEHEKTEEEMRKKHQQEIETRLQEIREKT